MKREMLASVTVLSLLFGGQALSQSVSFEMPGAFVENSGSVR
jgi:hypothetical protein